MRRPWSHVMDMSSRRTAMEFSRVPGRWGEDLAFADMVGRADDALGFHALDEPRGAVVADLQIALHKARRGLALAGDERHRLVIQRIARAAFVLAEAVKAAARAVILGDVEEVLRLAVPLQER